MASPKTLRISVDIEKSHQAISKGLLAIGVAVRASGDTNSIFTKVFPFCVPEDKEWDPDTLEWFKSGEGTRSVIERLKKIDAKDDKESMKEFMDFVDELEKKYPDHQLEIVTDNPAYDVGHLDAALERFCGRLPLQYDSNGKYRRKVVDPTERLRAFDMREVAQNRVDKVVTHSHWPSEDAENRLRLMNECDEIETFIKNLWKTASEAEDNEQGHKRVFDMVNEFPHFQEYKELKCKKHKAE